MDLLPSKLPGDVALIFGTARKNWVSLTEGSALEWSPLKLVDPEDGFGVPWTGELPYEYQGVLHRTVQYRNRKVADPVFESVGFKDGSWALGSIQLLRSANMPTCHRAGRSRRAMATRSSRR